MNYLVQICGESETNAILDITPAEAAFLLRIRLAVNKAAADTNTYCGSIGQIEPLLSLLWVVCTDPWVNFDMTWELEKIGLLPENWRDE